MEYLRSASVAAAIGTIAMTLAVPPASAAVPAQQPTQAAAVRAEPWNFGRLNPKPWEKREAAHTFKTTKKGKVQIALLGRSGSGSIGLRLISCKGRKGLTSWQQMNKLNHRYTFSRTLNNGVCFKVQAGRSWVESVYGYVYGYVKWI
jgi:hypothetical protein